MGRYMNQQECSKQCNVLPSELPLRYGRSNSHVTSLARLRAPGCRSMIDLRTSHPEGTATVQPERPNIYVTPLAAAHFSTPY